MRYKIYSCCTQSDSRDFDKPPHYEGSRDSLSDTQDLIRELSDKGRDAWYEPEEDED